MTGMERKRRAPDVRGAGVGLGVGVMIAMASRGPWWSLALVAGVGVALYHVGVDWE